MREDMYDDVDFTIKTKGRNRLDRDKKTKKYEEKNIHVVKSKKRNVKKINYDPNREEEYYE